MGTFEGHVGPGLFFGVFGAWHFARLLQLYFRDKERGFRSNTFFPINCCFGGSVPIESYVKLIGTTLHFLLEYRNAFEPVWTGKFENPGNVQHMAILSFFFLQALTELLYHYRLNIPRNLPYITLSAAFLIIGVIFMQHLHGHEPLDVQLHMLLVYLSLFTALMILCEMRWRQNVMIAMIVRYLVILEGSWFCQVGFILFPPSWDAWDQTWDHSDGHQAMLVGAMLGFHGVCLAAILMAVWLLYAACQKQLFIKSESRNGVGYELLKQDDLE